MEEHCILGGFDFEFTTPNYGITTTPKKEYELLMKKGVKCDPKHMLDKSGKEVRVIKPMSELKNLELCRKAELTDEEVLAVVSVRSNSSSELHNNLVSQHVIINSINTRADIIGIL
jgi:hypothetical protein